MLLQITISVIIYFLAFTFLIMPFFKAASRGDDMIEEIYKNR